MVNEPIYRVVQLEYFYRVAKIDGSKFISNGRNNTYFMSRIFRKIEAYSACSLLNNLHKIKKSKKNNIYDLLIDKYKTKKLNTYS